MEKVVSEEFSNPNKKELVIQMSETKRREKQNESPTPTVSQKRKQTIVTEQPSSSSSWLFGRLQKTVLSKPLTKHVLATSTADTTRTWVTQISEIFSSLRLSSQRSWPQNTGGYFTEKDERRQAREKKDKNCLRKCNFLPWNNLTSSLNSTFLYLTSLLRNLDELHNKTFYLGNQSYSFLVVCKGFRLNFYRLACILLL